MILFVSGRCDIPAHYSLWLFHRFEAGFVDVRNPFDAHQISRIFLNEQNIDALLFCTKNPLPMMPRLKELAFPFLFHVTITPYHADVEPFGVDKQMIIEAVKELSDQIGRENVVVRYDPILFTNRYTPEYHVHAFHALAKQLEGVVSTIVISFVDLYKNTKANAKSIGLHPCTDALIYKTAQGIGAVGKQYGISVQTCHEPYDLRAYGIEKGACVSVEIMERLLQRPYVASKGKPIRNCGCIPTVDIGDYNACPHLCKYCYANYDERKVRTNVLRHDPTSSILLGHVSEDDHIIVRKEKGHRQMSLF